MRQISELTDLDGPDDFPSGSQGIVATIEIPQPDATNLPVPPLQSPRQGQGPAQGAATNGGGSPQGLVSTFSASSRRVRPLSPPPQKSKWGNIVQGSDSCGAVGSRAAAAQLLSCARLAQGMPSRPYPFLPSPRLGVRPVEWSSHRMGPPTILNSHSYVSPPSRASPQCRPCVPSRVGRISPPRDVRSCAAIRCTSPVQSVEAFTLSQPTQAFAPEATSPTRRDLSAGFSHLLPSGGVLRNPISAPRTPAERSVSPAVRAGGPVCPPSPVIAAPTSPITQVLAASAGPGHCVQAWPMASIGPPTARALECAGTRGASHVDPLSRSYASVSAVAIATYTERARSPSGDALGVSMRSNGVVNIVPIVSPLQPPRPRGTSIQFGVPSTPQVPRPTPVVAVASPSSPSGTQTVARCGLGDNILRSPRLSYGSSGNDLILAPTRGNATPTVGHRSPCRTAMQPRASLRVASVPATSKIGVDPTRMYARQEGFSLRACVGGFP